MGHNVKCSDRWGRFWAKKKKRLVVNAGPAGKNNAVKKKKKLTQEGADRKHPKGTPESEKKVHTRRASRLGKLRRNRHHIFERQKIKNGKETEENTTQQPQVSSRKASEGKKEWKRLR